MLASSALFAETDNKYWKLYNECVSSYGEINNTVVYVCSENVSMDVKKEMNRLYSIIYKDISESSIDDAKKFEDSQKAWLKYRNSHCELMGAYVGSPMYAYCPLSLNIDRLTEMKTF